MRSDNLENEELVKSESMKEGNVPSNIYKVAGTQYLNVRTRPSTNNKPKFVVDKYETLEIVNKIDDVWAKVKVLTMDDQPTGYVQTKFITNVDETIEEE